ncbi:MAG TPA: protein kinase [Actinomycetota bacterium]|jgi:serine/threonine-protein kinase|nr:protein kinase [Actinomycetota bacterium]
MVEGAILAGRYRLEERLAIGGMGAVWIGRDETLSRRVAVKLLREEYAHNPSFIERFRREARAAAALAHPNIAAVYDYGQDDGARFIVMELAAGRDLAQLLREEGALNPERAARIAIQILEALDHAHGAGVVHRDVKPGNVIVSDRDHVKVTDFGIARAAGEDTLTATGAFMGSAHYIAPEQAQGGPTTPRTDIYSAGVVLYEMLTGAPPFAGESPLQIAMRHATDEVPPPSRANSRVGPELDAIVARATAKDPEERYESAAKMAAAIRDSVSSAPAPAARSAGAGAGAAAVGATLPLEEDATRVVPPETAAAGGTPARRLGGVMAAMIALLGLAAGAILLYGLLRSEGGGSRSAPPAPADTTAPASPTPTSPAEETTPSPSPSLVFVPGVVGMEEHDAEKGLEDQGFEVSVQEQASEEAEGIVVAQDPAANSRVEPGSAITLYVSTGPEGQPSPSKATENHGSGKAKGHEKD